MKKLAVLLALMLSFSLTGCGASNQKEQKEQENQVEQTGALVIDEATKTITVQAVATAQTDSSIHLLVNEDGGNADKSFFVTEATSMEFYRALVELNAIPGNNIPLDAKSGTILGSGLEVTITVDGKEYDPYDLITASEKREMDVRFGGNIAVNQEYSTGCLLCMESCSAGVASDAAYEYCEEITFTPSDAMPKEGTEVTFTFKVDDTTLVIDEENGTIALNAIATGYSKSTIHAIVNEDGGNADKTLFTTSATTKDFYDALKRLGGKDGNNIALDDKDGVIEGTSLGVNVEIGTENYSFEKLFTTSESRAMDIRFGGNLEVNQEYATGCVMCLESCPAGITSNAAFQYKEAIEFGPSDKMPATGEHIIVIFTVGE